MQQDYLDWMQMDKQKCTKMTLKYYMRHEIIQNSSKVIQLNLKT